MPTLLTQRRPRKKPPCGRIIQYQVPHSPFQKLIDGRRAEMGLSYADLAEPLGINRGSVWIWMHNANGFPHPKSCKPEHLLTLAKVLKLDHAEIQRALDASRHLYTPREESPLPQARDALATLIEVLEHHAAKVVRVSYVLNLAKRLQAGVPVPAPPAPRLRPRAR